MRYAVDGYNYMLALGFPGAARICLTHSYPTGNAAEGSGAWDGSDYKYIIPKWEAFFEIKSEFERSIGGSVYDWLPGVVENTFDGSSYGRMDNS